MYSVVLMMALSNGGAAPAHDARFQPATHATGHYAFRHTSNRSSRDARRGTHSGPSHGSLAGNERHERGPRRHCSAPSLEPRCTLPTLLLKKREVVEGKRKLVSACGLVG